MGNSEKKLPNSSESIDEELAKDIARLYNWAQVEGEGVSYRDFSRQRKPRHIRTAQGQDIEGNQGESAVVFEQGAGDPPSVDIPQAAPAPEQPLIVVETSASQVSTDPIQPEP